MSVYITVMSVLKKCEDDYEKLTADLRQIDLYRDTPIRYLGEFRFSALKDVQNCYYALLLLVTCENEGVVGEVGQFKNHFFLGPGLLHKPCLASTSNGELLAHSSSGLRSSCV